MTEEECPWGTGPLGMLGQLMKDRKPSPRKKWLLTSAVQG
jgi:hypothetical protein